MKKFVAILMTLCLLASILCVSASAFTISTGDVIRVYGLKWDDTSDTLNGYTRFDEGWEAAVDWAEDHDFMDDNGYDRIMVELLADWNANDDGEFGDSWRVASDWGDGFQYSTIFVPSDTRMMINMNGHTINRGLKEYEHDGEVICIGDDADLIINGGKRGDPIVEADKDPGDVKLGTIKGGFSCNGAGGIHMQDGSRLTLNNVNITGNIAEDDDGGGIAVYDGATLTMNGGSITNNALKSALVTTLYGAGVYIEDSTASFNNVIFKHNHSNGRPDYKPDDSITYSSSGAAIYAEDSKVDIDSCRFYDNGHHHGNFLDSHSVIHVSDDVEMTVKNTTFKGNGAVQHFWRGNVDVYLGTMLMNIGDCNLTIEGCQFADNRATILINADASSTVKVSDTSFTNNYSTVYRGAVENSATSTFVNCTFDKNAGFVKFPHTFEFDKAGNQPTFVDCEFGDSSFNDRSKANIIDSDASRGKVLFGSILGDGSPAMIVSLVALVMSASAIGVCVASSKKKSPCADADKKE